MSPFTDTRTHDRGLYENARLYEFTTEMAPGVWKVHRKTDRMEFLAHDITDKFVRADPHTGKNKDSKLQRLLLADELNMVEPLSAVLNHENLVSMVDIVAVKMSGSGRFSRDLWFTLWDFCDAGNLGNLLVPHMPVPVTKQKYPGDELDPVIKHEYSDDDDDDADKLSTDSKTMFLPESFCWHVLYSMLRALAWLHDGAREIKLDEQGKIVVSPQDVNWQPMLHRDISPANIFLGHPKRMEWYGTCKLGNYGDLYVTGHCHGETLGNKAPKYGKALAPPLGEDYETLEELIKLDSEYGSTYPQQPEQPYTMLSEYRALGEVIQAMMVKPVSNNAIARIRTRTVLDNLRDADYTAGLKNLVVKLMEDDPWANTSSRLTPQYVTSGLMLRAWQGFEAFKKTVEGRNMISSDVVVMEQVNEDLFHHNMDQESLRAPQSILAKQDKLWGDVPRDINEVV